MSVNDPSAPFAYADRGYQEAALKLRRERAGYFATVKRTAPDFEVWAAQERYNHALVDVRREEQRCAR